MHENLFSSTLDFINIQFHKYIIWKLLKLPTLCFGRNMLVDEANAVHFHYDSIEFQMFSLSFFLEYGDNSMINEFQI